MFMLGKSLLLLGRVESEENAQLESTNQKKTSFRGFIFQGNELNAVSKVMQEWRIHQKWSYPLPKTNSIAPARRPSQKDVTFSNPSDSGPTLVSGSGVDIEVTPSLQVRRKKGVLSQMIGKEEGDLDPFVGTFLRCYLRF